MLPSTFINSSSVVAPSLIHCCVEFGDSTKSSFLFFLLSSLGRCVVVRGLVLTTTFEEAALLFVLRFPIRVVLPSRKFEAQYVSYCKDGGVVLLFYHVDFNSTTWNLDRCKFH